MKKALWFFPALLLLLAAPSCSGGDGEEVYKETPPPPYTVFKGKNLVTFGNSITSDQSNNKSWAYQTQTKLGFGDLYNGAFAGAIWYTRVRNVPVDPILAPTGVIQSEYTTPETFVGYSNGANNSTEDFQKIINNCAVIHVKQYLAERNPAKLPDVIILSYGTNDMITTSGVNTMGVAADAIAQTDITKLDLTKMVNALKWCLVTLKTSFPAAKIYVALPLQASTAKYPNKNSENLTKMEGIKAVCNSLSIPYFDSYNESGITDANQATYLRDGLHPNGDGQNLQANYIVSKLKAANPQ